MNRQIRKVAWTLLALFGAVLTNLVWLQFIRADELAGDERNTRLLLSEYSLERGSVLTEDGVTITHSVPTPDRELRSLRGFPHGPLYAHITGYYSVRFGREGLEKTYNEALTGKGGVLTMQDLGDRLFGDGEQGDTLILHINSKLQQAAFDALGDRRGAVVALDPASGAVLALVSKPTFDPNPLSEHSASLQEETWNTLHADPAKPLLNRATADTYPPGSTFKVITSAAALNEGLTTAKSFPFSRSYTAPNTNKALTNFGGASCGGDMINALRTSCNTYYAQLGVEMGAEALRSAAESFGFGEVLPIDLRSVASRLPSEDDLDTAAFRAQASIGQHDVSATPLQMALVAAAVANEGKVPVPQLVKEIRDPRGVRREVIQPEMWKQAISPEIAKTLKDMMLVSVSRGYASTAGIPGVSVGGKTGTAETGRGDGTSHVWVITFAPGADPKIAMAVFVEAGERTDATGAGIAAPIASKVMQAARGIFGW